MLKGSSILHGRGGQQEWEATLKVHVLPSATPKGKGGGGGGNSFGEGKGVDVAPLR